MQQKKLEIVIAFERMQRKLDTLRQRYSQLQVETRSSFFVILSCYVSQWTEEDKLWLVAMRDARVLEKFRCKEREDR